MWSLILRMALFCLITYLISGFQFNDAFYRKWTHTCSIRTSIYLKKSVIGKEERADIWCAAACLFLLTQNCTMWIWDKAKKECHFHGESANVYSLTTSKISAMELYAETSRLRTVQNGFGTKKKKKTIAIRWTWESSATELLNKTWHYSLDCSRDYNYDVKTKTCFKVILQRATWKNARKRCNKDCGDLISLPTKEKWDLVINDIKCGNGPFWFGLRWGGWLSGESFVNVFGDNVYPLLNNYDRDYKWIDREVDCANVRRKPWTGNPSALYIWDESCNYRTYSYICEINLL